MRDVDTLGAFVLASLTFGCGGSSTGSDTRADARVEDDADPGGGADASSGAATITVIGGQFDDGDGPQSGLPVLFISPDGAITEVATDAAGRATTVIGPDADVLVLFPDVGNGLGTVVIQGVEPGDDLVIGDGGTPGGSVGSMTLELPVRAGATRYDASLGCYIPTSGDTSIEFGSVGPGCVVDGKVQYLASALAGGLVVGFLQGEATFVNGATVAAVGDWVTPGALDVTFANVAVDGGGANVADIWPIDGERAFGPLEWSPEVEALPAAPGFAHVTQIYLQVPLGDRVDDGFQQMLAITAEGATEIAVDVAAEALPTMEIATFDPDARTITVTRGPGAAVDARVTMLSWSEDIQSIAWIVMSPPDREVITLPLLPEPYDDRNPDSLAITNLSLAVVRDAAASDWEGYDDARGRAFEVVSRLGGTPHRHPAPARIQFSQSKAAGVIDN